MFIWARFRCDTDSGCLSTPNSARPKIQLVLHMLWAEQRITENDWLAVLSFPLRHRVVKCVMLRCKNAVNYRARTAAFIARRFMKESEVLMNLLLSVIHNVILFFWQVWCFTTGRTPAGTTWTTRGRSKRAKILEQPLPPLSSWKPPTRMALISVMPAGSLSR